MGDTHVTQDVSCFPLPSVTLVMTSGQYMRDKKALGLLRFKSFIKKQKEMIMARQ